VLIQLPFNAALVLAMIARAWVLLAGILFLIALSPFDGFAAIVAVPGVNACRRRRIIK